MKLLIINPPNKPFSNTSILAEPIDILQIATIVNEKYKDLEVVDMDVNKCSNEINGLINEKDLNVIIFVLDYQIPLHTTQALFNVIEIANNIKYNNKKVIMIGKISEFYSDVLFENNIDFIICGPAEKSLMDLLAAIENQQSFNNISGIMYKDKNKIVKTDTIKDYSFENLPVPNRKYLNLKKYIDTRTMLTSRGCINNCNFCPSNNYWNGWHSKKARLVYEEILYLIREFNTEKILFLDDNATVDYERMNEICDLLINNNVKIKLGCLSSINTYSRMLFEKMYLAGFRWVHFGIESGSLNILNKMNKHQSLEKIEEVISEVKSIGFRIRTSWIIDYPGSTEKDINDTFKFIEKLNTDEIRIHFFTNRINSNDFNKNILEDQYIHRTSSKNEFVNIKLKYFSEKMQNLGYKYIDQEINWDLIDSEQLTKIIAVTPIKYGISWHE